MPTLILKGHHEHYAATELLRLFFGNPVSTDGQKIQAGLDDLLIESSVQKPDHPERAEGATMSVRVVTRMRRAQAEQPGVLPLPEQMADVPAEIAKREIKRQLYQVLAQWTGRSYPWGSLVGIRPTLVAAECLAQSPDDRAARRLLTDLWFVSPAKADLAVATAHAEQAVLASIPAGSLMVYIGVPFCPSRCSYCSFITRDAPGHAALLNPYVDAVIHEAQRFFAPGRAPVAALYIGGGTPTSLSAAQLERLLHGILPHLPLSRDAEITVEAGRPDTVTPDRLTVLRKAGVNRLCINPQTFHDETLGRIGRCHNTEQTLSAYRLARAMGFTHINLDLIAGLPGEAPEDFSDSLRQALSLDPTALTLHALAIKRSSGLHEAAGTRRERQNGQATGPVAGGLSLQPEWAAMLHDARCLLAEAGLLPYYLYRQKQTIGGLENTGFARQGKACLYNVGMMSDRVSVIGIGSGAMTKKVTGTRVDRLANPRDLSVYLKRIQHISTQKTAWYQA